MALWDVVEPVSPTFLEGGEAPLSEIWAASRDAMIYADNTDAREMAREAAFGRRIDAIKAATGVELVNPHLRQYRLNPEGEFYSQLRDLSEKHPDAADIIGADRPIEEEAFQVARDADERQQRALASRDDWGATAASFGGGAAGSLRDPLTVMTLFLGGGAGGARTIGGRILHTALTEAAANGGTELLAQPVIQGWREDAGLEAGFDEAARNVLFATAFGGALGAGGRSLAEGAGALLRRGSPTVSEDEFLRLREDLPDDARGALDALEDDVALTAMRPQPVGMDVHDDAVSAAIEVAENPDLLPERFVGIDTPARLQREIDAFAGAGDAGTVASRQAALAERRDDISGFGDFGPQLRGYENDWMGAVARMRALRSGELQGVLSHPQVGEIDVIWGSGTHGLQHIIEKHPDAIEGLPEAIRNMEVIPGGRKRVFLGDGNRRVVVGLDFDGQEKKWLLTAYEDYGSGRTEDRIGRSGNRQDDTSSSSPTEGNITPDMTGVQNGERAQGSIDRLNSRQEGVSSSSLSEGNIASAAENIQIADDLDRLRVPRPIANDTPVMPDALAERLVQRDVRFEPRGAEAVQQEQVLSREFSNPDAVAAPLDDGGGMTLREALDDIEKIDDMAMLVEACKVVG